MSELDFPDETLPKTQTAARAFIPNRTISEREIVSACWGDGTGQSLQLCRSLPRALFKDKLAWSLLGQVKKGINGHSDADLASLLGTQLPEIYKIKLLDPDGVRLHANLTNLRSSFRQSEVAEASKLLQGDAPNVGEAISRLNEAERAQGVREEKLQAQLDARAYNPGVTLEKPNSIYSLKGTTICTAGNLTTILSQAKAGKSAIVGAMIGAAHTTPDAGHDTLSITGPNYACHALLHFETEQSPYDWQQIIRTGLRRIGVQDPAPWFKSYALTGLDALTSRALLALAIRQAYDSFGGIHAIIIDGTADLVVDPNDPQECFPFVTQLHGLAIEYKTAIINVVHMNPGTKANDAKARGHLGSQLERKSESNLMLEKSGSGVTSVWGVKQRGKMIMKSEAAAFEWSDEHSMHVSTERESTGPAADGTKRGKQARWSFALIRDAFPSDPAKAVPAPRALVKAQEIEPELSKAQFYRLIADAVSDQQLARIDGAFYKYHLPVL